MPFGRYGTVPSLSLREGEEAFESWEAFGEHRKGFHVGGGIELRLVRTMESALRKMSSYILSLSNR